MQEKTEMIERTSKPAPHKTAKFVHDSNPFTTAITGIKKLFTYNTGAFIGVVIFNILAGAILIVTVLAMGVSLFAFLLNHVFVNFPANPFPSQLSDLAANVGDVSIYATFVIGLIIAICVGSLMQIIAIRVASVSALKQEQGFGQVLKYGFGRILPMIGLAGLLVLAVLATISVVLLLIRPLGFITIPIALIIIILGIYASVRLTFMWFSLIDGKSPIEAVKESWALTDGRFFETIGISTASSAIVAIPMMVIGAISSNIGGVFDAVVSFLIILAACGASVIILAGIAERFWQFRRLESGEAESTKVHPLNYWAVVIYIAASMITGALSPQNTTTKGGFEQYFQQQIQNYQNNSSSDSTNPDDSLNDFNQPDTSSDGPSYNYQ